RCRHHFFSLLHSGLSEYPDEWLCVIEALTLGLSRGDPMQCANEAFASNRRGFAMPTRLSVLLLTVLLLPGQSTAKVKDAQAVGRFPARTEGEVKQMVQKTLAFEQSRGPAPWRNRLTLLVGNPGGASAIEKQFAEYFLQSVAGTRFDRIHPQWTGRGVIHAPQ